MIKHNGYYLNKPISYTDYVVGGYKITGIIHTAYLFLEDGKVLISSKEVRENNLVFDREDFDKNHSGEYYIEKNYVSIIFDKNKEWELKKKFEISNNYLICIESNSASSENEDLKFIAWNEN